MNVKRISADFKTHPHTPEMKPQKGKIYVKMLFARKKGENECEWQD